MKPVRAFILELGWMYVSYMEDSDLPYPLQRVKTFSLDSRSLSDLVEDHEEAVLNTDMVVWYEPCRLRVVGKRNENGVIEYFEDEPKTKEE